ncbi:AAA family ATPase [Enterovibrio nigricans]|uniref:DNA transposition protein, AAA+ family ATPase n=1 Tax=Enterovibrio nigricans DSM 22720 TaxID=1121868 RepID=A0A1T4VPD3_9GAMM|nr:AAA family ATPase [Enterovibrio nigricans]SKA66381.1 hypothetical protein SAMN02745132_04106 [Enterovibrio nigricans DSM 22720]
MNQIIEQVKQLQETSGLSNRQLAKQAGFGEAILSGLFKGSYPGNSQKYLEMLQVWVSTQGEFKESIKQALSEPGFINLPTAKRIINLMSTAQTLSRWSMAYEGSGVGKTMAAKEYQRTHSNVWIITASAFCKTSRFVLGELGECLGIRTQGMTVARMSQAIAKELDGAKGLIVVDEAQYLSDDVLNGLRILSEGKAGVMLLGNDMVRTRMSATRSIVNMKPVWSRIIHPAKITEASKDDIEAYVKAWGITNGEMISYAKKVTPSTNGQLRTLGDVIKLSLSMAHSSGCEVSLAHMKQSFDYLTASIK